MRTGIIYAGVISTGNPLMDLKEIQIVDSIQRSMSFLKVEYTRQYNIIPLVFESVLCLEKSGQCMTVVAAHIRVEELRVHSNHQLYRNCGQPLLILSIGKLHLRAAVVRHTLANEPEHARDSIT